MENEDIINPIPLTGISSVMSINSVNPVKTSEIDAVIGNNDTVPVEALTDLLFENIGGQEILSVARNDTVNGQKIIYQPIKNLTSIQQQYNPNNIVALQSSSDKYFANFSIKFESKVPLVGSGPNGEHVYIDPTSGDLIIDVVNTQPDEQVEIEIATGGTIYEVELWLLTLEKAF